LLAEHLTTIGHLNALTKKLVKAGSLMVNSSELMSAKLSDRMDIKGAMDSVGTKVPVSIMVTSVYTWVTPLTNERGTLAVARECRIL